MSTRAHPYKRHRFLADVIQYAVWLHYRFNLSHRDIEELLAQRRIDVSLEENRNFKRPFGVDGEVPNGHR